MSYTNKKPDLKFTPQSQASKSASSARLKRFAATLQKLHEVNSKPNPEAGGK